MAITAESWLTLRDIGEDVLSIVRKLAATGHVESIQNALTSGILDRPDLDASARVARAFLPLFGDQAPAKQVASAEALLRRFLERAGGQEVAHLALLGSVNADDVPVAGGFAALIKAGADPWRQGPGGEPSPVAAVALACIDDNFAKNTAPKLLACLLPDFALTTLKSPAKMIFPGMAVFGLRTQVSMFEASIMLGHREIADWLGSCVPSGNDEVWLQLGDRVLRMLEIEVHNGQAEHKREIFTDTQGARLAAACRLIARGAQFRDGAPAWDAVAKVQTTLAVSGPDNVIAWLCRGTFGTRTTVDPRDRKDALCALFRHGSVDISAADKHGRTPLMHASVAVLPEMVEAFLLMGADPSVRSKSEYDENETAEEIVRRVMSRSGALQVDERTRIVEMLRAASLRQVVEKTIAQASVITQKDARP